MPGPYLGEPSTPNHPRAPSPTRTFMPLDAPLLASGGPSNALARARRPAAPPHVSDPSTWLPWPMAGPCGVSEHGLHAAPARGDLDDDDARRARDARGAAPRPHRYGEADVDSRLRCREEARGAGRVRHGRGGDQASDGRVGQEQGQGLARLHLCAALVQVDQRALEHEAGTSRSYHPCVITPPATTCCST